MAIGDVKAHAMAVQMWAEPLGLVGHPDYYRLGDETVNVRKTFQQTAFVGHFPGFYICIIYYTTPLERSP
jgi:hypothetical protein